MTALTNRSKWNRTAAENTASPALKWNIWQKLAARLIPHLRIQDRVPTNDFSDPVNQRTYLSFHRDIL